MRAAPNLSQPSVELLKVSPDSPGLLDALFELAKQRQQILTRMKEAVEKGDRDAVFHIAEEFVGLCEPETQEQILRQAQERANTPAQRTVKKRTARD